MLDATTDRKIIDKWYGDGLFGNIGIRCDSSGLVVLDIDPRNGGWESLASLIKEIGSLPETVTIQTGGGGLHYYFKYDYSKRNQLHQSSLGPGIDIKQRGYVVAPPSVVGGSRYQGLLLPGSRSLVELPDSLLQHLEQTPNGNNSNSSLAQEGKEVNPDSIWNRFRSSVHMGRNP